MRRKEGSGGRRNEKSEKKNENEKVAYGRIIGLAGPCSETYTPTYDMLCIHCDGKWILLHFFTIAFLARITIDRRRYSSHG